MVLNHIQKVVFHIQKVVFHIQKVCLNSLTPCKNWCSQALKKVLKLTKIPKGKKRAKNREKKRFLREILKENFSNKAQDVFGGFHPRTPKKYPERKKLIEFAGEKKVERKKFREKERTF